MKQKKPTSKGPNWVFVKGLHETIGFPTYLNNEKRPPTKPWGELDGRKTKCIHEINIVLISKSQLSRLLQFGY